MSKRWYQRVLRSKLANELVLLPYLVSIMQAVVKKTSPIRMMMYAFYLRSLRCSTHTLPLTEDRYHAASHGKSLSPSHVWYVALLLIIVGFVASSLPLAGVGMTRTDPHDVN